MKLLVIIPSLDPKYGGPANIVQCIAALLAARGIHVDVVTLNSDRANNQSTSFEEWIIRDGYRIRYFLTNTLHKFGFSIGLTTWLFRNIKSYDLVHVHGIFSYMNLVVYQTYKINGIPYVVSTHGMLEPWALAHKAWKKKIYYTLIEKSGLAKAAAIHAAASPEAKHLRDLKFKGNVFTIHNGVEFSQFETLTPKNIFINNFKVPSDKHIILFLGRLHPKKGIEILVSAFCRLYSLRKDIHLVLAGPDTMGHSLKIVKFLMHNKCSGAVTFTGMVTGEMKLSALASANVFVLPSFSEGFSVSVLEAMATGLPSIITTACNFQEAEIAKTARVIEEPSIENTYNALVWGIEHDNEALEMGNRAREWIRNNYSYDVLIDKYIDMYNRIVGQCVLSTK